MDRRNTMQISRQYVGVTGRTARANVNCRQDPATSSWSVVITADYVPTVTLDNVSDAALFSRIETYLDKWIQDLPFK